MSQNPDHLQRGQPNPSPTGSRLQLAATGSGGRPACETVQAVTLIGSRRDCHLPVNDPDVSKVHCAVVHTGRGFLACDLCSRGGTYVNGHPVRVAPLRAGDRLQVAAAEIDVANPDPARTVHAEDPAADGTQPDRLTLQAEASTLRLTAGAAAAASTGVDLLTSAAMIGRRSTCDVIVDTPDVSLVHALIFTFDGQPVVADLGSRSGTWLNGHRVQLAWLRDGDELSIGGQKLRVVCDEAARAVVSRDEAAAQPGAFAPIAYPVSPDVPEANAVEELMQAVLGDLSTARARLDERATEAEKRQAELDTLATLLSLQSEHMEQRKAELSRRESELSNREADLEQATEEARRRLEAVVAREQAVAAAWAELDRWHATWESGRRVGASPDVTRPAPQDAAGLAGLPDAPPIAQAFPPPVPPATPGGSPKNV